MRHVRACCRAKIGVQRSQLVALFPVVEASQLIALQALLALLEHMRHRAALKRLVPDHRDALAHLREGHRWGPFFSPDRFPAPGTTWPVRTVFDDGANPSNGAPHNPPTRLRSCCAGGMLRCDVPLWPPEHIPPVASQG